MSPVYDTTETLLPLAPGAGLTGLRLLEKSCTCSNTGGGENHVRYFTLFFGGGGYVSKMSRCVFSEVIFHPSEHVFPSRAAYHNSDIYLIDDIFSVVEDRAAIHIFTK